MINYKITRELKKRFLDELRTSKETDNERGFIMYMDKKGNLAVCEYCT